MQTTFNDTIDDCVDVTGILGVLVVFVVEEVDIVLAEAAEVEAVLWLTPVEGSCHVEV